MNTAGIVFAAVFGCVFAILSFFWVFFVRHARNENPSKARIADASADIGRELFGPVGAASARVIGQQLAGLVGAS